MSDSNDERVKRDQENDDRWNYSKATFGWKNMNVNINYKKSFE